MQYEEAGVSIAKGDALIEAIAPLAKKTQRPEILGGIGGFAALSALPCRYRNPILVSSTDGVGTKLLLAIEAEDYTGIGIDLVAMCVNDLIVCGAEPLFFLDYFAQGTLDVAVATEVIKSITVGCLESGASLVGGETAELPGLYRKGHFDLAGFAVGVVEKEALADGSNLAAGDCIIGLPSSGIHSNGFSLVRAIRERHPQAFTLAELLTPTRLYVKPILALQALGLLASAAHITGGGLPGNLPRTIPSHLKVILDGTAWTPSPLFNTLKRLGNISEEDMLATFNCGIGMAIYVKAENRDAALKILQQQGESPIVIGALAARENDKTQQVEWSARLRWE